MFSILMTSLSDKPLIIHEMTFLVAMFSVPGCVWTLESVFFLNFEIVLC